MDRKAVLTLLAAGLFSTGAFAGEPLPAPQIINVEARQTVSLDGLWKTIVDPYENGYYDYRRAPLRDRSSYFADDDFNSDRTKLYEYNFNTDRTLNVPGDWNTQRPELYYYEGTVWYRNRFPYHPKENTRTFLYFGAANYETVAGHMPGAEVVVHLRPRRRAGGRPPGDGDRDLAPRCVDRRLDARGSGAYDQYVSLHQRPLT